MFRFKISSSSVNPCIRKCARKMWHTHRTTYVTEKMGLSVSEDPKRSNTRDRNLSWIQPFLCLIGGNKKFNFRLCRSPTPSATCDTPVRRILQSVRNWISLSRCTNRVQFGPWSACFQPKNTCPSDLFHKQHVSQTFFCYCQLFIHMSFVFMLKCILKMYWKSEFVIWKKKQNKIKVVCDFVGSNVIGRLVLSVKFNNL